MPIGRRDRLRRHRPNSFRQPWAYWGKDQPVVAPEALSTAHRLQQKYWQDETLAESAPPGTKAEFTATIAATIDLGERRIGGVVHTFLPRGKLPTSEGRITDCHDFNTGGEAELRIEYLADAADAVKSTGQPHFALHQDTRIIALD